MDRMQDNKQEGLNEQMLDGEQPSRQPWVKPTLERLSLKDALTGTNMHSPDSLSAS